MVAFTVNGKAYRQSGDLDMPLLWFLRDLAGLRGTKFGCGIGACGACTVHLDGQAVRSCVVALEAVDGSSITTIEGLADATGKAVQRAWTELSVPQCGYCQPGMIMAATTLLRDNPSPSDAEIDAEITNICRCGTYNRIRHAIRRAAGIPDAQAGR